MTRAIILLSLLCACAPSIEVEVPPDPLVACVEACPGAADVRWHPPDWCECSCAPGDAMLAFDATPAGIEEGTRRWLSLCKK